MATQGQVLLLAAQSGATTLTLDCQIPVESCSLLAVQVSCPVDTLLTVSKAPVIDGPVFNAQIFDETVFRSEFTEQLDREIPVESGMALSRSEQIPIDSIGSPLVRDETIPVDSVSTLAVVTRDESIPIESGGLLVKTDLISVEALLIVDGTPTPQPCNPVFDPNVFDLSVFDAVCPRVPGSIPIESGMLLVGTEQIPIDSGITANALVRDEIIPVETGGLLTRNDDIPVESGIGLAQQETIPVENGDLLTRNDDIPVESGGSFARDENIPVESGLLLARREDLPVESGDLLTRDDEIPVETSGLLTRDEEIPVEQFPQFTLLTRDEAIPIETLAALVRDEEIPYENSGVVLTTLVRDEDIPVESLAQTLPFSFMDFLAGAGAPWPPSWLSRPKLLADERHCGMVRFYGRSRQVVRRPKALPPIVIGKPIRPRKVKRSAVVQATLITRQLSESLIVVGGKSTQKIGHDWKIIREADEREIMTIIQVL